MEKDISRTHNKWIWKANIPLQIKKIMWQLFQDVELNRENMKKCKWLGSPYVLSPPSAWRLKLPTICSFSVLWLKLFGVLWVDLWEPLAARRPRTSCLNYPCAYNSDPLISVSLSTIELIS
jgi:hypothetical protein